MTLAKRIGATAVAALLGSATTVGALPATAGSHSHDHGHGHHAHMNAEHPDNPAVQAFMEANERMHQGMAIDYTGDADVDFARGMIPHHQGAIDMARIVLEHGTDDAIRQLAEEIIEAQEAEIAFLRQWLADREAEPN
ncbi:MAG: DUF305 domain-containing protein [Rhodospirillales bacterium]|nr:MAG: DUF305 domain-containing protein [Rhodospirillales bacterium]